ncbi:MAG: SRPBCC family protein [Hyphomicrobiales bacterium]
MVKVFVSSVIDASTDKVWNVVRDFNAMPGWHPAIARSMIEAGRPSDAIGCIRSFHLTDGTHIREQLLMLSDFDFTFTYSIIEAGLDLQNYVASMKLTPVTDGNRTFAEWTAEFETTPGKETEMAGMVSADVFQAGFDALKNKLAGDKP